MRIKVKENNKVYSVVLTGFNGEYWSEDLSDNLLTDEWFLNHYDHESFMDGYILTEDEFDELKEWFSDEAEKYNKGKSLEWLKNSDEATFKKIEFDVSFEYVDED